MPPGLQNNSLSQAQIAQLAGNYKLTPATLMAECADWWTPAPFLQYLAAEIAACVARGGGGLLISAPPRHGKSKLITVATPLWVLENFPHKNVIVATYGEDLSTDFTREVKDLIKANRNKLSIEVRRDVDRAANFLTAQGGGLKAVGLRGTITGRGADVLIIDDYIKEPKEALNYNYLESLWTWYVTVARTRLEPGAVVIIVATRWVTNDLHGRIERLEARRPRKFYKIIKIEALAKPNDMLGRKEGEALFPKRYSKEQLEDIRYELTNRWFEAMFQQNPQSEDSATTNVNNLRYLNRQDFWTLVQTAPKGRFKWVRGWDFAASKNAGDFTAGSLCAYDTQTKKFYIVGLLHGQYSSGRAAEIFAKTSGPEDDGGDPQYVDLVIEQEGGSAGAYALDYFKGLAPSRIIRVSKAAADGSKLLKAQGFIAATERNQVILVVDDVEDIQATPWVHKFVDEFAVFPEGGHDDVIDANVGAYNDLTGKKFTSATVGRGADVEALIDRVNSGDETGNSERAWSNQATFGRSVVDHTQGKRSQAQQLGQLLGRGKNVQFTVGR